MRAGAPEAAVFSLYGDPICFMAGSYQEERPPAGNTQQRRKRHKRERASHRPAEDQGLAVAEHGRPHHEGGEHCTHRPYCWGVQGYLLESDRVE